MEFSLRTVHHQKITFFSKSFPWFLIYTDPIPVSNEFDVSEFSLVSLSGSCGFTQDREKDKVSASYFGIFANKIFGECHLKEPAVYIIDLCFLFYLFSLFLFLFLLYSSLLHFSMSHCLIFHHHHPLSFCIPCMITCSLIASFIYLHITIHSYLFFIVYLSTCYHS